MDQARLRDLADQATARLLNKDGTVSSNRGGWMMIATILIEAWDLYAISFLLMFIKAEFNPTPVELGLTTAAVQAGALVGALIGGLVADRLGRKRVFLLTMILFIVLAVAQGFAPEHRRVDHHQVPDRHPARQRHRERLRLHHGVDVEGQAGADGLSLAVHVRPRRGLRDPGDHGDVRLRDEHGSAVADRPRARRRAGGDLAAGPARSAGDPALADQPRPVRRGQADVGATVRRSAGDAARHRRRDREAEGQATSSR